MLALDVRTRSFSTPQVSAGGLKLWGKLCVITGGTSGIGLAAAKMLAAQGARIILIARDKARGAAALATLNTFGTRATHTVYYADLSLLKDVKRVGAHIADDEPRIDILVNNAGAMFAWRELTEDRIERTLALSHFAPAVLTHALAASLARAAPARVINTTGGMHVFAELNLDGLTDVHSRAASDYSALHAYAHAKLCNVLFTRELARRWQSRRVTVNCIHPGEIATRFGAEAGGLLPMIFAAMHTFCPAADVGAARLARLAACPDLQTTTGAYFSRDKLSIPSRAARNSDNAQRLWEATNNIAQLQWAA